MLCFEHVPFIKATPWSSGIMLTDQQHTHSEQEDAQHLGGCICLMTTTRDITVQKQQKYEHWIFSLYIGKKGVPDPTYLCVDGLTIIFLTMEEVNTLVINAVSEKSQCRTHQWGNRHPMMLSSRIECSLQHSSGAHHPHCRLYKCISLVQGEL